MFWCLKLLCLDCTNYCVQLLSLYNISCRIIKNHRCGNTNSHQLESVNLVGKYYWKIEVQFDKLFSCKIFVFKYHLLWKNDSCKVSTLSINATIHKSQVWIVFVCILLSFIGISQYLKENNEWIRNKNVYPIKDSWNELCVTEICQYALNEHELNIYIYVIMWYISLKHV